MKTKLFGCLGGLAVAIVVWLAASPVELSSQQSVTVQIDNDDIGGVVTSAKGPEAGVWVIAETTELPTRFARMVVTDDRRALCAAGFAQGQLQHLGARLRLGRFAEGESDARQESQFKSGGGAQRCRRGADIIRQFIGIRCSRFPTRASSAARVKFPGKLTQNQWLDSMKINGCVNCHQLGTLATRTFPKNVPHPLGKFSNSEEAWFRRVQSGQGGETMFNIAVKELGAAPIRYFADWTDRIAKGELPHAKPPRPQGVERNIVVTTWDWLTEKHYLHDLIASDRRYPTVNAYGPIYGSTEHSTDIMPVLDPIKHTAVNTIAPVRDADTPMAIGPGYAASDKVMQPSPYWGNERIWTSRTNNHNGMFDRKGRVWFAATVRAPNNPDFCKKGSDHPSAKQFPIERTNRQLTMLDPKTGEYTFVDTCFGTHHLQFGYDANETLWTSGGGQVLGWVNTKMFDETGDLAKSQGWTPMILDTNGNGKRDEYVEPNQPMDPTKDKRISAGFYAVMPSPVDGSVWGTTRAFPGAVVRIAPGSNPRRRRLRKFTKCRCRGSGFAAATSTKKASCGYRSRAGISGASTGASAKGRLTGRRRPAIIAPRVGRFINTLVQDLRASVRTARSRATTPGSISTTPSVLARTCRCQPATCTMG